MTSSTQLKAIGVFAEVAEALNNGADYMDIELLHPSSNPHHQSHIVTIVLQEIRRGITDRSRKVYAERLDRSGLRVKLSR